MGAIGAGGQSAARNILFVYKNAVQIVHPSKVQGRRGSMRRSRCKMQGLIFKWLCCDIDM
jgi:hypothetical protein